MCSEAGPSCSSGSGSSQLTRVRRLEWRIWRSSAFSGARVLSRFCRMRWMSSALASKVADLVRV